MSKPAALPYTKTREERSIYDLSQDFERASKRYFAEFFYTRCQSLARGVTKMGNWLNRKESEVTHRSEEIQTFKLYQSNQ